MSYPLVNKVNDTAEVIKHVLRYHAYTVCSRSIKFHLGLNSSYFLSYIFGQLPIPGNMFKPHTSIRTLDFSNTHSRWNSTIPLGIEIQMSKAETGFSYKVCSYEKKCVFRTFRKFWVSWRQICRWRYCHYLLHAKYRQMLKSANCVKVCDLS